MARPSLQVRPATLADLPALLELGNELREQLLPSCDPGMGRGSHTAGRLQLEARYLEALADADRHLVVVVDPSADPAGDKVEQTLGMAMLTVAPANALLDHKAVHMTHAVVAGRYRRRGAGRALVAAAAAFADERGVDQLVVAVNPSSRDANRFFARLGFAPLAVRRVAPVAAVRRRLAAGELRTVEQVVRRRRRPVRAVPGLPLGPSTVEDT